MKKDSSTIRWDSREKKREMARIAKLKGFNSVNRLVNSMADVLMAQEAAEATFRALASRGNPKRALALLDKLDEQDRRAGIAGTQP